MDTKDISAVLRIEGGTADDGILDIYDAASTIYGAARAINIVAHSFANNEEVKTRAKAATDVQAFVHSSKKGCFEEQIDIRFGEKTIRKMGHTAIIGNFWDYIAWSWSAAIGKEYLPVTSHLQKIVKRDDEFVYVIADALETPMQKLHESIARNKDVKIFLARPRVGDLVIFDRDSYDFVTVRDEEKETSYIEGNVTKYNMLSDFGRLYSDVDEKTVSFRLAKTDERMRALAINSMKNKSDGEDGKIHLKVSRVVSAQGFLKRYIVHDILEKRP